jgi:EamA-like transporter family protein
VLGRALRFDVHGLLATALQHIPVYTGLRHTTATNGALLNATAPVFIAFLAAFAGDKLGPKSLLGIAIAVIGVLAVISRGSAGGRPAWTGWARWRSSTRSHGWLVRQLDEELTVYGFHRKAFDAFELRSAHVHPGTDIPSPAMPWARHDMARQRSLP